MIIGTGIDMVETDRMAAKTGKANGFREKVFSVHEIEFCERMADKAQHYAARFAAKEAFLKATGLGLAAGFDLRFIEVRNDESGKPRLNLTGPFLQLAKDRQWLKIHVSLSHVQAMACAVVIIEG